MSDPKKANESRRNPMAILAMALDRQADEEQDPESKADKNAAAARMRELAAKEPPPTGSK